MTSASLKRVLTGAGLAGIRSGYWPAYGHVLGYDDTQVISATWAASNTQSLPSGWEPDDLAIVHAYRSNNTTSPSLASGFTNLHSAGGSGQSHRTGFRILQAGDTSINTWTNASHTALLVLRDVNAVSHFGSDRAVTGSGTTPGLTGLPVLADPADGTDWLVAFIACNASTNVNAQTPSGWTNLSPSIVTLGLLVRPRTTSLGGFQITINASAGWSISEMQIRSKSKRTDR